ncbi:PREDICTED: coiled-coil domain-containing protein 37-like [Priapulus caudatus]|uniref:Coiled-coil domain-containing protein 37-like n=1 Tax=Priapulus caudatus TaxID=37621 RepID=A0ABM1F1F9_PRICU|nr:PREDICTED: coiled-coil domain-containing protein 37-like [Priapulus caudatus]
MSKASVQNTHKSSPSFGAAGDIMSVSGSTHDDGTTNPFKMPPDSSIFTLREQEKKKRKEERAKQRSLHVHEKTTYAARLARKGGKLAPDDVAAEDEEAAVEESPAVGADDPAFALSVTRNRKIEKENLAEYIEKKREMFKIQYALGVKRDEMKKLEDMVTAEERRLERAEKRLEQDAVAFDEFLKENDKNAVEAIRV